MVISEGESVILRQEKVFGIFFISHGAVLSECIPNDEVIALLARTNKVGANLAFEARLWQMANGFRNNSGSWPR